MPSGNLVKWFATKQGDAYKVGKDKSIYKIEDEDEALEEEEDTLHNDIYNSMEEKDQSLIDNILTQNYKQDSFSKAQAALDKEKEAEALAIFERLQSEAAADEAAKAAEIAQARFEAAEKFEPPEDPNVI